MDPESRKNLIAQSKQSARNSSSPVSPQIAMNLVGGAGGIGGGGGSPMVNAAKNFTSSAQPSGWQTSSGPQQTPQSPQNSQPTTPMVASIPMSSLSPPPTGSSIPRSLLILNSYHQTRLLQFESIKNRYMSHGRISSWRILKLHGVAQSTECKVNRDL